MCTRSVDRTCALLIAAALAAFAAPDPARAQGYPSKFDFGTPASTQDIAAVAIAIAPDGKGLPAGKGDYAAGKRVYETACAACHGANLQGVAGLPNMPAGAALRLIGGRGTLTTKNPVMTVESYWPYATTLFDYVRRAMPFQAPGSLTADRDLRGVGLHPGRGQRHRQGGGARRRDPSARADAQPRRLHSRSAA